MNKYFIKRGLKENYRIIGVEFNGEKYAPYQCTIDKTSTLINFVKTRQKSEIIIHPTIDEVVIDALREVNKNVKVGDKN